MKKKCFTYCVCFVSVVRAFFCFSDDESLPESDISLIDDSDLSNQDQIIDQMTLFDPVQIR
jgi:hypothetical protein